MYEVHVTVPREMQPRDFITRAGSHKVVVLSLLNGQRDMMTNVKTKNYLQTVTDLIRIFPEFTRIKVEADPKSPEWGLYYEAHFDGYIDGLPQSLNMLNGKRYSTLRSHDVDEFYESIKNYDKVKIEKVIIDTNPEWDDEWLNKNSS